MNKVMKAKVLGHKLFQAINNIPEFKQKLKYFQTGS